MLSGKEQWQDEREHLMASSSTRNREVRARIEKWLTDDDWKLTPFEAEGMLWAFRAATSDARRVVIGMPAQKPDAILVTCGLSVAEHQRQKLALLDFAKRSEFLWDLRHELLLRDVEFDGVESPLKAIAVHSMIFLDGLTQDNFYQRILRVSNAVMALACRFGRFFGEAYSPDAQEFVN